MDQVTPSPSPVASAVPSLISSITTGFDWGGLAQNLSGLASGVAQNPYSAGGAIVVVLVLLGVAFYFIKQKYIAWQQARAKEATQAGETNFVTTEVGQNQQNTTQDNTGRNQLNNLP